MPGEGIRTVTGSTGMQGGPEHRITVQGRTVRIHLAGILDRAGVQRMIRQVAAVIQERDLRIVLDGSRLRHLDYRCVDMLLRWHRNLRGYGHRLDLVGWNRYLIAILAIKDWDGELEDGFRFPVTRRVTESGRHVLAP